MAHELQIIGGKASMAYVGDDLPWHGLGQSLSQGATIEQWTTEAGMDWDILESPMLYKNGDNFSEFEGQKVLFSSNTGKALGSVSNRYKVVQPKDVLEFFRDLVTSAGMSLTTAGVLFDGRKFWAMADTGRAATVFGKDHIKGNLLLTTSCDGSMPTIATFVATRVVCNNTLSVALGETVSNRSSRIKVSHARTFDPMDVKNQLGILDESWAKFQEKIKAMADQKINDKAAMNFLSKLVLPQGEIELSTAQMKQVEGMMERYKNGMGSDMTQGTLWGLVNGVTEYSDHEIGRTRSADKVLWNSWFGGRSELKNEAFALATDMI